VRNNEQQMVNVIVIGTDSQRITVLQAPSEQAEKVAREFLSKTGLKFITDIFSMGEYRVWAEYIG
jgi:uncharacterized protein with GYD domain